MNKLSTVSVYVPVSVEYELPPYPQIVTVLIGGRIPMMAQIRPSDNGPEWWTLGMAQASRIEEKKKCVTHWLKETPGYFFPKSELAELLGKAFNDGTDNGFRIVEKNHPTFHSAAEYIKTIL